jgi:hypothetical protein
MPSELRTCSLCGYSFDASELVCHSSCPMSAGCHIICCPNCGYQVPDENHMKIAGALKRLWEARKSNAVEQEPSA